MGQKRITPEKGAVTIEDLEYALSKFLRPQNKSNHVFEKNGMVIIRTGGDACKWGEYK